MPYIHPRDRSGLDRYTNGGLHLGNPGELNYLISKICHNYLGLEPNYARINEVIGALECAKLELYRRIAVPYEDSKIAQNGPISELELNFNNPESINS